MAEFEDLAITGELIVSMPEAERWFEIIEKPHYENYPTEKDPSGQEKRKLVLKVRLSSGQEGSYYPNKTSARRIATITKETNMDNWVGKKFIWGEIVKQKVAGQTKDILYITEFYPPVKKVE
jgi:hypothetical protein